MKAVIHMIVVLTLSLSGCSSQNKMVIRAPFEMGQPTYETKVGGRAEASTEIVLEIPILSEDANEIKVQHAYFRGKIAKLEIKNTDKGSIAIANFRNQRRAKLDIIMHSDPRKEVGNQPPTPKIEFPFELEDDECVLSFLDGDTMKYVKVENIKENPPKKFK